MSKENQIVKVLVLILAIEEEPWLTIEKEGQTPTWKGNLPEGVEILRYVAKRVPYFRQNTLSLRQKISQVSKRLPRFGEEISQLFSINNYVSKFDGSSVTLDQDSGTLVVDIPELYDLIGLKTLKAFYYAINNIEFDYIYRTNVSSFLDLQKLQNYISDKPRQKFYAGHLGRYTTKTREKREIIYASGAGYFLSRDLVQSTLQHQTEWDHNFIDDVSLGDFLRQKLGVQLNNINRVDNRSASDNFLWGLPNDFHFRCKSDSPYETVKIMEKLQSRVLDSQRESEGP